MLHLHKSYYFFILCTSVLMTLVYAAWPGGQQLTDIFAFVLFSLLLGLAHGSADHLIIPSNNPGRSPWISFGRMGLHYLAALIFFSLLWLFMPVAALILFIAFSSFHFGQTHLLYLPGKNMPRWLLHGSSVLFGLWFLLHIILLHPGACHELLSPLFRASFLDGVLYQYAGHFMGISSGLLALLLLYLYFRRFLPMRYMLAEVFHLVLLYLIFSNSSLLLSFSIYFGLWHSLPALLTETSIIRKKQHDFTLMSFLKAALPLTLISLAFIGLVSLLLLRLNTPVSPYMVFFIMISGLTMPHIYYMDQLFSRERKELSQKGA